MIFMAVRWIPKRLVDISLVNVAAQTGNVFVSTCEEEYRERIRDAVDAVLDSGRHVVMLTGPSSSGKTTTAHKLAEEIRRRGRVAEVISLDDFFLDLEHYPRLPDGSKDYENITALDIPLVNSCLAEVVNTGHTMLPEFDFITESRKPDRRELKIGDGVLIVEGIHAHNPVLTARLPQDKVYKVYAGLREEYSYKGQRVLPTRDIRLARRMVRDYKYRGHSPEKTLNMWPAVCAGEDKYIKIFKPQADYLLDTSFSYEIECLSGEIQALAKQFGRGTAQTEPLKQLAHWFSLCRTLPDQLIPQDSMLREFLG